jgi:uncharacterized protein Yka (UPF0111/DUF47 family)
MSFTLFPKEKKFAPLFKALAADIVSISQLFKELAENYKDFESYKSKAAEIERHADAITYEAIHLLNTAFITPFDREDIHHVVHELDDIVDNLENQFRNIYLYDLVRAPASMQKFSVLIYEASLSLQKLVDKYLDPPTQTPEMSALKKHLHSLENQADELFGEAIHSLFSKSLDPIETIKRKDLLEGMEEVMDKYLAVTNTIENIIVKAR